MSNEDIPSIDINPNWIKGCCPGCKQIIYIDEPNRRTYHRTPLCEWYADFISKAYCEGEVELIVKVELV